MSDHTWVLRVVFDTPENTRLDDPWVAGEASAFVSFLRESWSGSTDEEFREDVTMLSDVIDPLDTGTDDVGDVVLARAELLDLLVQPLHWIVMSTIPREVTLTRDEDDDE